MTRGTIWTIILQIMQLIKQNTSYALRALLHMGAASDQEAFTAGELAEAVGTTTDFMHKIMQSLRQAGIVDSRRGPAGGFRLSRPVTEISLLEITAALQGAPTISRCIIGLDMCEWSANCPLRSTWVRVQKMLEEALRDTTLGDVLGVAGPDGERPRQ
ncbi:MAG: Rrf2 family transcriptional regulator [Armatimonadetes bacterium]|nr:Rrf2 family transcriptional regulator [Armatimonadota bacterium]